MVNIKIHTDDDTRENYIKSLILKKKKGVKDGENNYNQRRG